MRVIGLMFTPMLSSLINFRSQVIRIKLQKVSNAILIAVDWAKKQATYFFVVVLRLNFKPLALGLLAISKNSWFDGNSFQLMWNDAKNLSAFWGHLIVALFIFIYFYLQFAFEVSRVTLNWNNFFVFFTFESSAYKRQINKVHLPYAIVSHENN